MAKKAAAPLPPPAESSDHETRSRSDEEAIADFPVKTTQQGGESESSSSSEEEEEDDAAEDDESKGFDEMCDMYPYLAKEVKPLEAANPGMFKREFGKMDDGQARALDERIKRQIVAKLKLEMEVIKQRLAKNKLRMEVIKALFDMVGVPFK